MPQLAEIHVPSFVLADHSAGETIAAAVKRRDAATLRAVLAEGSASGALTVLLTSLALYFEGKINEGYQALDTAFPDREWQAVALTLRAAYALEHMQLVVGLKLANQAYVEAWENYGPNRRSIIKVVVEYATLLERLAGQTMSPLQPSRKIRRAGPLSFIISYPRSGNTMVMHALQYMFRTPSYSVFQDDACFFSRRLYDPADTSVLCVKDHAYRSEYLKDRAVYLVRDGRDSMVSLCQFIQAGKPPQVTTREQFGDFLLHIARQYEWGFWSDNVRLALEAQEAGAQVMISRYEDLVRDPAEYFRIGAYIAADRMVGHDAAAMKAHVDHEKDKLVDFPEWGFGSTHQAPELFSAWQKNRGKSSWRMVFDDRAKRIFHELGGTEFLLRFGYEIDPDWWKKD